MAATRKTGMKRAKIFLWLALLALAGPAAGRASVPTISIVVATNAAPRIEFGAEKLAAAIQAQKISVTIFDSENVAGRKIYLDQPHNPAIVSEGYRFGVTNLQ